MLESNMVLVIKFCIIVDKKKRPRMEAFFAIRGFLSSSISDNMTNPHDLESAISLLDFAKTWQINSLKLASFMRTINALPSESTSS